jgi:hypothetical protein
MTLIPLKIKGISYSQTQNGAYALILNEIDGERKLPIVIGAFEAQSIAIALEKEISPPRPLTHDLFKNFASHYEIGIKKVIIHRLVDGVFYANIVCESKGEETIFDARTSDAIALALRFNAPIFTYESILSRAGIHLSIKEIPSQEIGHTPMTKKNTEPSSSVNKSLHTLDLKGLETELEQAVIEEDYEKAARIRDEISKRN